MAAYFTTDTFRFLKELAANNRREWFVRHKARYQESVQLPAMRFITDVAPLIRAISPHFTADPRPVGGSLFRIHRDTRFSKDKSPYKTHTGIQLRHARGTDVHAPGFYLHLQPGHVFVGVGIWHPDPPTLRAIREAIVERPAAWRRAVNARAFAAQFVLDGETLVRPPAGFAPDHPLIDDLRRKDFIGVSHLTQRAVLAPTFPRDFAAACRAGAPLVKFLCGAAGVPF